MALAMVTLNRKRGDFLKIFCSHQLHAISFLPNIQCWWDLKEIKAQIPPNFVQNLLTTGPSTQALPLAPEVTHSGFILSKKDYELAED